MKKLAIAFLLASAFAQQPTVVLPKTPAKDLQLALEREKNIMLQGQLLQQQFAVQEAAVAAEIEKVKKDNGWGEDVTLNRQTGQFEKAPKPEAKK